ncbi:MAG: 30S ribosomal protein S7 [Dictyoglomus sp.]|nr:30S ribosomal protein S7 [Dictyoglomus sp.]MDW8189256.1 30S ribosomal protein S7 [Dictyoglomus sp.]
MPRRGPVSPREIPPDPVYNSVLVQKLINKVMLNGKKSIAEKIVYGAIEIIRERTKQDPIEIIEKAVRNATPLLEVRPRRVGGATYQVPIEVSPRRGLSLALRWIVRAARERKGMPMKEKLANEILDALNNTGGAIKKKDEMHRMAEANKAFAHYRW